ncbi:methyltransferase [Saccharothrix australiensis]|uniref:Hydroxyneurosporene-O-methyltransferase n=1 Tax=Saccharothrix australiensis TaxID=2072 RepID=A0A495W4K0_9PSEU|nr:methyltransferase [Saccharothrix australiensis]RKT55705.1 hydroxyneurosporene-O-methyltransferase [Saccharothrix australiensis]
MTDDSSDITGTGGDGKPPAVRMYELLYSSLVSQLIIAVADLGVADAVGDGTRHVDELAEATGSDPRSLYRALRALASVGVFTETSPRRFALTPLAETLRADRPGSMRDLARYVGLPERQRAFGALAQSLRTGKPSFDHVHGQDWWSFFAARPELATLFNSAMSSMARMVNGAALDSCDLSDVELLVDVGGGRGTLAAMLLDRYPGMRAVVFDLPRVVPEARAQLDAAGFADRARCVGGDFLREVPEGGDAYVLSWTIHDWDDEDAVTILRNIREAMGERGRLLVIDEVIPEGDARHFGKFEDVVMMCLLTGQVRTEAELRALFERAGLRHVETRNTPSPTSVVVATRA